MLFEIECNKKTSDTHLFKLYVARQKGYLEIYDLKPMFDKFMPKITAPAEEKSNYNPLRECREDFQQHK